MTYLEKYKEQMNSINAFKESVMNSVVSEIKNASTKPIHIGNHWFFYVKHNGKDVPAYCHQKNYHEDAIFLPIYDEDNTEEFGWSDFNECCRIFDLIKRNLNLR